MRDEQLAKRIFARAIVEGRCAELLEALFDGGTATVDAVTGKLVVISADTVDGLVGIADEGEPA